MTTLNWLDDLENWWHRTKYQRFSPFPLVPPNVRRENITEDDRLYLSIVDSIQKFQNLLYLNDALVNNLNINIFRFGTDDGSPQRKFSNLINCGNCYLWLDFATRNINQTRTQYLILLETIYVDYGDILPIQHLYGFPVLHLTEEWLKGIGRWERNADTKQVKFNPYFFNPNDFQVVRDSFQKLEEKINQFMPMVP